MPLDQQCSRATDCDSVPSLPASLFDLERLFDPYSTPTIHLGRLPIPGPLVPLIIAVVFIIHNIRQFRARRDRGIQIDTERLPPTPRQNSLAWPGLSHPDALRVYVAKVNLGFHGVVTQGAIMHFGRSFLGDDGLCCAQVLALLVYGEVVRPEMRRSCLSAAVGWMVFMFLDRIGGGVEGLATGVAVIVLAAPVAWQVDGNRDLQQSVSGLLLMLMVARRFLFDDQVAAQQWVEDEPMRAGKYLATLYVGNGLMVWAFNRNHNGETRIWGTRWDLQQMVTSLKQSMPVIFNFSILAAAFLGIFVGGIVCTAYLSSCLLWRRFFFYKCASSPSLSPFSHAAGAAIYSNIFLVLEMVRQQRGRGHADRQPATCIRTQVENGADVIGWACLFLNTLYMAIEILL
jgi:hypothetical protein